MKVKLEELKTSYKALLNDAEKLIGENKLEEAKAKQAEAKKLREQIAVVKAQVEAQDDLEKDELKSQLAEAEKKAKTAVKPPFTTDDPDKADDDGKGDSVKSFMNLRFGETDAAIKGVIADIYGSEFNYNQARNDQMIAFVKYIRFGESRLTAKDVNLLAPSWKNIILRPEMLKNEILSGRSVNEIKVTLEEGGNDLGGLPLAV